MTSSRKINRPWNLMTTEKYMQRSSGYLITVLLALGYLCLVICPLPRVCTYIPTPLETINYLLGNGYWNLLFLSGRGAPSEAIPGPKWVARKTKCSGWPWNGVQQPKNHPAGASTPRETFNRSKKTRIEQTAYRIRVPCVGIIDQLSRIPEADRPQPRKVGRREASREG